MRINFITFSHKLTGGTRVIMEIIDALALRGHEVSLVTFGNPKDLEWIDLHAKIYFINRTLFQKIAGFLYRLALGFQPWPEEETRKILDILPEADINVATNSYSGFAAHRSPSGVPFHYFMHYEPLVREDWGKKKIMEESYFIPTHKIANSTWLAKEIKKETGREVDGLVFPAINHAIFYPRNTQKSIQKGSKITVVSLAKDKWWKGFPDALRAIDIVRKAGYNISFKAFGSKLDQSKLPDDVKNISFEFVGSKVDSALAQFYSDAHILISASHFESFPLPPLEAMACGTPVVTTVYGTEDYAHNRKNSLVVEPKQPEALAKAIIEFIDNPALYAACQNEGIATAKKFTWESAAEQIEALFKKGIPQS